MSSVICKQHPVDIEPIFCLRILEENYISANYNLRKNNTIALKVDFIEQDLFDTYLEEIIDYLQEDTLSVFLVCAHSLSAPIVYSVHHLSVLTCVCRIVMCHGVW